MQHVGVAFRATIKIILFPVDRPGDLNNTNYNLFKKVLGICFSQTNSIISLQKRLNKEKSDWPKLSPPA